MRVLAALDEHAATTAVVDTAVHIAEFVGADLLEVHVVGENAASIRRVRKRFGNHVREVRGKPARVLAELACRGDIGVVVVGARHEPDGATPVGHVPHYLVTHSRRPVVVVPPDALPIGPVRRVLVPLENSRTASHIEAPLFAFLGARDVAVTVLHVVDETGPALGRDVSGRPAAAWIGDFMHHAVQRGLPDVRLEIARGKPAQEVVAATYRCDPDLVAVNWSQQFQPEHANVVRALLSESRRPVLLLPEIVEREEIHAFTTTIPADRKPEAP